MTGWTHTDANSTNFSECSHKLDCWRPHLDRPNPPSCVEAAALLALASVWRDVRPCATKADLGDSHVSRPCARTCRGISARPHHIRPSAAVLASGVRVLGGSRCRRARSATSAATMRRDTRGPSLRASFRTTNGMACRPPQRCANRVIPARMPLCRHCTDQVSSTTDANFGRRGERHVP